MKTLMLTVLAFGLSSSAFAEDKTPERLREEGNYIFGHEGLQKHRFARVVPSETNQRIGFFSALNPDCTTSGDISIRVTKEPQHGAVQITPTSNFPNNGSHYPNQRPHQCHGGDGCGRLGELMAEEPDITDMKSSTTADATSAALAAELAALWETAALMRQMLAKADEQIADLRQDRDQPIHSLPRTFPKAAYMTEWPVTRPPECPDCPPVDICPVDILAQR
jgi:hypothetical protein